MATFRHGGFLVSVLRSDGFLYCAVLLLGNGYAIMTVFVLNYVVVTSFYFMELNGMQFLDSGTLDKPMLHYLWYHSQYQTVGVSLMAFVYYKKNSDTQDYFAKASQLKTDFLCRMSHELRTPLSGIIGAIDLLKSIKLDVDYEHLLEIAETCSQHLLATINDILDFSKMEADKMKLVREQVNLSGLLTRSFEVISPLMNKKALSFKVVIRGKICDFYSDAFRLQQILINLLSNAIKFTNFGSVTISVSVKEDERIKKYGTSLQSKKESHNTQQHKYIKFSVTDTGIGLEEDELKSVFKSFEQFAATKGVKGGTGLGLAICKKMCHLMEGSIHVKSLGKNKGSTFYLYVPYQACDPLPQQDGDSDATSRNHVTNVSSGEKMYFTKETKDGAEIWTMKTNTTSDHSTPRVNVTKVIASPPVLPRTQIQNSDSKMVVINRLREENKKDNPLILIAEDNKVNQIIIRKLVERLGYRVDIANDGQQVIDMIEADASKYPVILLDLEMPVLDGIEAAKKIRKMGLKSKLIALTAHAVIEQKAIALQAGFDDFVTKPVASSVLQKVLEEHFKKE
jgi:signal transduction histidine kinase/CheY-like chemotaxis protein